MTRMSAFVTIYLGGLLLYRGTSGARNPCIFKLILGSNFLVSASRTRCRCVLPGVQLCVRALKNASERHVNEEMHM